MSRKHYSPEQIIYKIIVAEVLISQGLTTPEAARQVGIVEQTYYRWRKAHTVECVRVKLNVLRCLRHRTFA